MLNPSEVADQAARSMLEKKAGEVRILDLTQVSSIVDYFVIGSADSEPQMKAIVEKITEDLEASSTVPWHIEGTRGWRWVLLDYVDVVVHVFGTEARRFYGLERLWGDAPTTAVYLDPVTGRMIREAEAVIQEKRASL
jgi:ribosome-associated protein